MRSTGARGNLKRLSAVTEINATRLSPPKYIIIIIIVDSVYYEKTKKKPRFTIHGKHERGPCT